MNDYEKEVAILLAALSEEDETDAALEIMKEMSDEELHNLTLAGRDVMFTAANVVRARARQV